MTHIKNTVFEDKTLKLKMDCPTLLKSSHITFKTLYIYINLKYNKKIINKAKIRFIGHLTKF